ncbi:hypothetical protein RJ639_022199 [Escallonia herrerae]|uniref:Uncharacterized protein n=1 Tax=Escallonia herrerae TaxID=1293975 RepID=A0AA89AEZ3_9ASTE|nr:hypothetical protein RJ639_022199 [Escallonia herrerae]
MNETQKMVDLKNAYADIILNTAKEAAARIMVFERNALRFQHELCSTKDEAIGVLTRLKQMIHAKSTEAENASLRQQMKIEELEAQLDEAEGLILDLREEVEQVKGQLDKMRINHVQHLNGPIGTDDTLSCEDGTHENKLIASEPFSFSPSDARSKVLRILGGKNFPLSQRIPYSKCCNSAELPTALDSQSVKIFDSFSIPSIIVKSKEPELYRNGCTHRIRAIGVNLLEEKLSHGDVADEHLLTKSESVINRDEQNIGKCTSRSPKTEKADGSVVMRGNSSAMKDQPVKVRKLPRSKTIYVKPMLNHAGLVIRSSCLASHLHLVLMRSKSHPQITTTLYSLLRLRKRTYWKRLCLRRRLRKRKVRDHDNSANSYRYPSNLSSGHCRPSSLLSCCKTKKFGKDRLETESEAKIKKDIGCVSAYEKVMLDTDMGRECGLTLEAVDEDANLVDASTSINDDSDAAEKFGVSTHNMNLEVDFTSSKVFDSIDPKTYDATTAAASRLDNPRLLHYTFSRKRKKGSLTNFHNSSSSGNHPLKKGSRD